MLSKIFPCCGRVFKHPLEDVPNSSLKLKDGTSKTYKKVNFDSTNAKPQNAFEESLLIEALHSKLNESPSMLEFLETVKKVRSLSTLPKIKILPPEHENMVTGACYMDALDEVWLSNDQSFPTMIQQLIFEYCNAKRRKEFMSVNSKLYEGHYRSGLEYAEAKEIVEYETFIEYFRVIQKFYKDQNLLMKFTDEILFECLQEAGESISGSHFKELSFPTYWKYALKIGHVKCYVDMFNRLVRKPK